MSNYVQSTNFATKDALSSGDPLKIVKGTEINIEFNNIATAVATKADLASPTLVTPNIGTPSAGVLTSCTGLPIIAGTSGTLSVARGGTGVTTSTGTGDVVLSTSPTLVTPALGTPASGNLANCTFPTLNQNTTGNAATATTASTVTTITTAQTLTAGSAAAFGDVGSYAFLRAASNVIHTAGTTYAGSGLRASAGITFDTGGTVEAVDGATPSGTWRAMGERNVVQTGCPPVQAQFGSTLYLRVS